MKSAEYLCKTQAGAGYVSTGIPIIFPVTSKTSCTVSVQKVSKNIEATVAGVNEEDAKSGISAFIVALFQVNEKRTAYLHWNAIGTWK